MLKYMRENAGSWGIRAIFVILVLAFIGWGGGGISDFFQGTDDLAASVNGTTIKRADYENRARRLLQTYRSQYRAILKKDITPQMELEYKKSLLERMIERELLLQTIDEMGLAISNSAVSEAIKAEDSFKDEKTQQFSYELYTRLLRANQLTPEAYELERRRDLLIEQLRTSVEDFVKVSAAELESDFLRKNEQLDLNYVAFSSKNFEAQVEPSPEELRKTYEENAASYQSEEQRRVTYTVLDPSSLISTLPIPDEAAILKEFETKYKGTKDEPEMVRARHILFKTEEGADNAAVLAKAQEVLSKLRAGADFADMAKLHSDDAASARDGGDLGFFGRDKMVKVFEEAAFALQPGALSEPVQSDFGYHLIKVEERRAAVPATLERYREEIISSLRSNAAAEQAKERLRDLRKTVTDTPNLFEKHLAEARLPVQVTPAFTKDGNQPGIPDARVLTRTAFAIPAVGRFSAPQSSSSGSIYLLRLDEIIPPAPMSFEDALERVKKDHVGKQAKLLAKAAAEDILTRLRAGETLSGESFQIQTTGPFFYRRVAYLPKIGAVSNMKEKLASITKDKPRIDEVIEHLDTYYCLWLKDHLAADTKDFEQRKDEILATLLQEKKTAYFNEWKEQLKEKAEINRYYLFYELPEEG